MENNGKIQRKVALYELADTLVALAEPRTVAQKGLEVLARALSAKGGVCILKTSLTQSFELAGRVGVEDEAFDADKWGTFCERPDQKSLGALRFFAETEFAEVFGDLLPAGHRSVFLVPLAEEGELCGSFFLFDAENCDTCYEEAKEEAEFLAGRILMFYRSAVRFQEALGLAYIDSLTDLYNARYLPMILEKRIAEARKERHPLSLLFLDMDNFREINNLYGHQAGGKALIEVGWILERFVRANDTVIRYGGDEFTIVLPNASTQAAKEIAERIRKAVKEHSFLRREGRTAQLTVSIGVATFPDDASSPEALLHLADQAMYRGKETTRDAVYSAADHLKPTK